ncbi:barren [Coniophora puteana RWD-64-598 SS2]|uniref:Condensin complex subunit 2 n=1 Tax=Coniophora puteana (strain RWD-64-598) TaxID=741705 RepID=A0A5M3MIX7_CONPW|nr:barren [Coniophora puteana RWD-64-598 SS2]EIW79209.1 barren [Coniophora puteana RWD-64-598 SS2]
MVQQRHARIAESAVNYYSDSGEDTEAETPRTTRPNLKKRLSERFVGGDDGSYEPDTRQPLQTVNINDDAAEKRRRRKSVKPSGLEGSLAGPSSEGDTMAQDQPESSRAAQMKQRQQQLNAVAAPQPPVINVPHDVMAINFDEWMKLVTDNKINAGNAWNVALIDYFHDLSLMRNDGDKSINFQRASATLDGCVKIWTNRVDSVGTETGKLLSNLANEGGAAEEEDEPTSDNPDGQDPSQAKKRKKTHRHEATLAKDVSQLKKKVDTEFKVDPLFRKTCADFDEGGAQGLLMNHLSLGMGSSGGLRVVFDASDAMGRVAEDEEDEQEPEEDVDLSYLRQHFLPDLDDLEDKEITHSITGFSFSQANTPLEQSLYAENSQHAFDDDDDDNEQITFDRYGGASAGSAGGGDAPMDIDTMGAAEPPPVEEDFFQGDQAADNDWDGGFGGGDDYGGGEEGSPDAEVTQQTDARPGGFVPFDPRRAAPNERDLILAMTDADDGGMAGYFDANLLKNWAGPEHWKLRKVIKKPEAPEGTAAKPRREKKEAFKIDFLTPAEKDIKATAKELFAPVTRGAGITLPNYGSSRTSSKKGGRGKKSKDEKRDEHTLPDDMHFASTQLVTLFLKPKFSLKMRGQRVRYNENGDGEIDEKFWAQTAADEAAGRVPEGDETGDVAPFNTQFLQDDYDDGPGFDDIYEGDAPAVEDAGEQDLLAATAGRIRRVRPETVNYAKRAKRVDVRKLKENIWKGLDIKLAEKKEEDEDEDDMDVDDDPEATDPTEARTFDNVISSLQQSYPKDKMEEISTSFCFICLLHLANEQGLKIRTNEPIPDDEEEEEEDESHEDRKNIGDIWGLQIYRDPNATRSA